MWGVMGAGAIYLVFALLIKLIGMKFIDRLFPPVVRHLSLPVGIAFLLIAYAVFAAASKHYKSTGS